MARCSRQNRFGMRWAMKSFLNEHRKTENLSVARTWCSTISKAISPERIVAICKPCVAMFHFKFDHTLTSAIFRLTSEWNEFTNVLVSTISRISGRGTVRARCTEPKERRQMLIRKITCCATLCTWNLKKGIKRLLCALKTHRWKCWLTVFLLYGELQVTGFNHS